MFKINNNDYDYFGPSLYQSYIDDMQQSGGKIGYYFQASNTVQKGSGVGSFLAGLARPVYPILKRAAVELSPHVLKLFRGVASDVLENPSSLRTSLKNRTRVALQDAATNAISKLRGGKITVTTRKRAAFSHSPALPPQSKRHKISIKSASENKTLPVKSKSSKQAKATNSAKKIKSVKTSKSVKVKKTEPQPAKVKTRSRKKNYSFFY